MRFQTPLVRARLICRYKRFLADMTLEDGSVVTAHCANPGSMLGLREPGMTCWLEPNDDPRKKLRYSWKLAEMPDGHMVTIDTALANRVVGEALRAGRIPELADYDRVRAEVPYGQGSRVDFLLSGARGSTLVEVKSVTLSRGGWCEFPDSVTARGAKHLAELAAERKAGQRAVILYLVSRTDAARFRLAVDLDPSYAAAHEAAASAGVETLCYATAISTEAICLAQPLPFTPPSRRG